MGLTFSIEHEINDYTFFLNSNLASFIYIYDPMDYVYQSSGAITERIISPGQELFMSIYPQLVTGTQAMRSIEPDVRGCLFPDEKHLNDGYKFKI